MQLIKAGEKEKWNENNLLIVCNFNMNCNFHCSYCINQNERKKYNNILSKKALYNLISHLPQLNRNVYRFSLVGGEPSLYPYLPDMLSYINEFLPRNKSTIKITTNGSTLEKLETQFLKFQDLDYRIGISIHQEQMSINDYLSKFSKVKNPERCRIYLMLEPKTLNTMHATVDTIKAMGFRHIIISPIIIDAKKHPDYTEEEIHFIDNNPYKQNAIITNEYIDEGNAIIHKNFTKDDYVLNPELANYGGLKCMAGFNAIRILPNGSITPCFFHKGDPEFNLNKNPFSEYKYLKGAVTCPGYFCNCLSYALLPKWNPHFCNGPDYFIKTNN